MTLLGFTRAASFLARRKHGLPTPTHDEIDVVKLPPARAFVDRSVEER
jgi:hypothetical protein